MFWLTCYSSKSSSEKIWMWCFHMLSKYLQNHSIAGQTGGYDCDCKNSICVLSCVHEGQIFGDQLKRIGRNPQYHKMLMRNTGKEEQTWFQKVVSYLKMQTSLQRHFHYAISHYAIMPSSLLLLKWRLGDPENNTRNLSAHLGN